MSDSVLLRLDGTSRIRPRFPVPRGTGDRESWVVDLRAKRYRPEAPWDLNCAK